MPGHYFLLTDASIDALVEIRKLLPYPLQDKEIVQAALVRYSVWMVQKSAFNGQPVQTEKTE